MGAELAPVLDQAHALVASQLAHLRSLAERTRQESEAHNATLRQAERQQDELVMQVRAAQERRAINAPLLARRLEELKARCAALGQSARTAQHALKQLEQLIRQIEMSSDALVGKAGTDQADPWALALRAQVIHGREEERLRLAREVHDGPAQVLANTLMVLETCYSLAQQTGSARLVEMLDRVRGASREGLLDVRRFIADLRPGKIEERGLGPAIHEYVRGYMDAYSVRVHLEIDPLPQLSIEAAIVLYRIVQEALQNAHKYARGAPITVRLNRQGTLLHLSVRDEGPGFDIHEVARRAGRSSWGLTSMRERAELVGARLTVISRPGQGTEVQVVLPLER